MLYARGGFQIDFEDDKFVYLAFFLGPDEHLPPHESIVFSQPRIHISLRGPVCFSSEMKPSGVSELLGKLESEDTDADEIVMYYSRRGVTMEFEFDGKTRGLKRVNRFPAEIGCY